MRDLLGLQREDPAVQRLREKVAVSGLQVLGSCSGQGFCSGMKVQASFREQKKYRDPFYNFTRNIGASRIRIGFRGIFYYNYN